jgi:hypothetical protein
MKFLFLSLHWLCTNRALVRPSSRWFENPLSPRLTARSGYVSRPATASYVAGIDIIRSDISLASGRLDRHRSVTA